MAVNGRAASTSALRSDTVASSQVNLLTLHGYHGRQRGSGTDGHELDLVKRWENSF